ncbi:MAG: serine/threonine protein kinase [Bryobacterales bacterium]|nr:serine/threonine protein kinase [Bryobacterales bacterium]
MNHCASCGAALRSPEEPCPRCLLEAAISPATATVEITPSAPLAQVGPYVLIRPLGRGGMGSVYLARHEEDGRSVALKIVRPEVDDPEIGERFHRERDILAALDHPNIARYLDGGTTSSGSPYLVMEYVEGLPLDQYCDSRELDVAARLRLFDSLCAAVHYLHMRGVVHRDLKPSNILVTADGAVKLLDFGIAKLMKQAPGIRAQLTRSGLRLMTPEYASPEQVRGEAVTPLSDVYALGVVLYELLTGHRPYRLQSRIFHEIVRAICEEPPTRPSTAVGQTVLQGDIEVTPDEVSRKRRTSPKELERELSGDLDAILLRAMEKDPRQRYWSADQLYEDIRAHLQKQPVLAEPRERWIDHLTQTVQRNAAWLIGAVTLLALLASGSVTIHRTGLLIVGAAIASFALWKLTMHPVLGRRLASMAVLRPISLLSLALLYFGVQFLSDAMIGWMRAGRDMDHIETPSPFEIQVEKFGATLDMGEGVVWLLLLSSILLNLNRRRWAGEMLLRIPVKAALRVWGTLVGVFLVFNLAFVLVQARVAIERPAGRVEISSAKANRLFVDAGLALVGVVLIYWSRKHAGRLEVRRRGIVLNGVYRRWIDIRSYHWVTSKWDVDYEVLHAEVESKWPFARPLRIEMWKGDARELNAILETMLRPWPAESNTTPDEVEARS